jgi:hypothetical protein
MVNVLVVGFCCGVKREKMECGDTDKAENGRAEAAEARRFHAGESHWCN